MQAIIDHMHPEAAPHRGTPGVLGLEVSPRGSGWATAHGDASECGLKQGR